MVLACHIGYGNCVSTDPELRLSLDNPEHFPAPPVTAEELQLSLSLSDDSRDVGAFTDPPGKVFTQTIFLSYTAVWLKQLFKLSAFYCKNYGILVMMVMMLIFKVKY